MFDYVALWIGRVVLVAGGIALAAVLFYCAAEVTYQCLNGWFQRYAAMENFRRVAGEMRRRGVPFCGVPKPPELND